MTYQSPSFKKTIGQIDFPLVRDKPIVQEVRCFLSIISELGF